MYGGDEVNAIVLDLGAGSVKAGYAGEDTPKAIFPSVVGCRAGPPAADGKAPQRERFVGSQALGFRRDNMEVVPALANGLYDDWELLEDLWNHAFSDRLRIDPKDHPLMLAEPSFQPREARERVVTRVFEGCSAPALFLAKNAALSSYATGRQTSLVVDMGCEGTVGVLPASTAA
ncbi:hypothetical protein WJX81_002957 [Elliptochloris bilobata]|uniref:Actin n=1 Tax=Elliptochloris bilobata TaxID=381761 RepID=A0AAW1S0D5_9CHLO